MGASLTAVIAVAGTLLGSAVTYLFQQRVAQRSEAFSQSERLRQERLAAYSAFAEAIMMYRQSQYKRGEQRLQDPAGASYPAAKAESFRLRALAWNALYRLHLLAHDPALIRSAENIMEHAADLHRAESTEALKERGTQVRQLLESFMATASAQIL